MGVTIVINKKGCFFSVSVLLYEFHGDNVHNEDDNGDGDDYISLSINSSMVS